MSVVDSACVSLLWFLYTRADRLRFPESPSVDLSRESGSLLPGIHDVDTRALLGGADWILRAGIKSRLWTHDRCRNRRLAVCNALFFAHNYNRKCPLERT